MQLDNQERTDLRSELDKIFGNDLTLQAELSQRGPSPKFIGAVFHLIQVRLEEFMSDLTFVETACHLPNENRRRFDELYRLLGLGRLGPADCVVVLTAKTAGATAILADDRHFSNAGGDLSQTMGLEVLS